MGKAKITLVHENARRSIVHFVHEEEFLGVSYRHLLHTLKEFRYEGLITKEKKGYKIDTNGLGILAKDI